MNALPHSSNTLSSQSTRATQLKSESIELTDNQMNQMNQMNKTVNNLNNTATPTVVTSSEKLPENHNNSNNNTRNNNNTTAIAATAATAAIVEISPFQLWTDIFLISSFAYIGVLTRYGTNHLANYDSYILFTSLYAQIVGCFIMGILISCQLYIHPRLYIGLSTGLCGSITTFSSYNIQAMQVLVGWHHSTDEISPVGGFRFVSWLTILIIGYAVSVAFLSFGRHCGEFLKERFVTPSKKDKHRKNSFLEMSVTGTGPKSDTVPGTTAVGTLPSNADNTITTTTTTTTRANNPISKFIEQVASSDQKQLSCSIAVFVVFTVIIIVVPYTQDNFTILFDAVFAPFGALLRFALGSKLNIISPTFPVGTFAANIFGTAILGMLAVVQNYKNCFYSPDSTIVNAVVQGLMDGFCGALTTISTFVVETCIKLPVKSAYIYGFTSMIIAQLILLAICGGYSWTRDIIVC